MPAAKHPGATCRTEGCSATAVAVGLCPRHYRWRRDGRDVCAIDGCARVALTRQILCRGHAAAERRCAVEGCAQPVKARRLCNRHYKAQRRPACGRAGCDRPVSRRGLCQACYDAERLRGRECAVAGCARQQRARGWCALHYNRWLLNGEPGEAAPRRVNGRGHLDAYGYRWVTVAGDARREHHVVMEATLGRPLRPYETVHHRNGVRDDNRRENLELWASAHPAGARVEDLVDWVVAEYADRVRQRLAAGSAR